MTRIVGLAAPYNVPNAYNETLLPGAFNDFLSYIKEVEKIPMLFNHKGRDIGKWTGLKEAGDGLYVDGLINDPQIEPLVRAGKVDSLSINFVYPSPSREAAREADRTFRHLGCDKKGCTFRPLIVPVAGLAEISVVKSPAFKESKFHWEPLDNPPA